MLYNADNKNNIKARYVIGNLKGHIVMRVYLHKLPSNPTNTQRNHEWHAIITNGKTQPTERITRQKFIAHHEGHYDRFFTRDDVQKWEHEFTRTAQFKELTAYTKPHSYLDEFIPF